MNQNVSKKEKYNPFKPENRSAVKAAFKYGTVFMLVCSVVVIIKVISPELRRSRLNICEEEVEDLLRQKSGHEGTEWRKGQQTYHSK